MPLPVFKVPSSAASWAGGGVLAKAARQRASQYAGVSQARTARSRRGQHVPGQTGAKATALRPCLEQAIELHRISFQGSWCRRT